MISALLITAFFASLYEINAACFRLVNGSKENVAAIQGVQDRLETLRNLAYSDLTDSTYVRNLMTNPSNTSEFAKQVVEQVKITAYDANSAAGGTTGSGLQITRPAGASATPAIVGTPDPNLAAAKAVLVEVKYEWTGTLGSRARSEETSSIVAAGVKK